MAYNTETLSVVNNQNLDNKSSSVKPETLETSDVTTTKQRAVKPLPKVSRKTSVLAHNQAYSGTKLYNLHSRVPYDNIQLYTKQETKQNKNIIKYLTFSFCITNKDP